MQFFAQGGRESLAAQALAATTRSMEMCQHLGAFDSREHEAWCEQVLSERLTTTVGEPESRGTYLKKHTTFVVTLEPQHYRTRRRFSDFEWLHDVLRARYVGMLVPSLPEKTVLKSDAFIQSRIRGLAIFLESVVQSPYLRSDEAVSSFFTSADEKDWETAKKETAVMENAGAGHLRWLMRISAQPARRECDAPIAAFKRQLEILERALVDISGCTKRIAEKSAAHAKDVSALHTLFNGWRVSESAAVDPVNDAQDAAFSTLLENSTAAVLGWSQVIRFEPVIYELLLHESVKYLLHQTKDFKEILATREQALHAVNPQVAPRSSSGLGASAVGAAPTSSSAVQSAASVATSTFSAAALTASSFAARFRNSEVPTTTEESESHQKRARLLFDLVSGALASEEIKRFRRNKFATLSDLMSQLACAEAQLSKRSSSMWREFLKTSSTGDSQTLMQTTKVILDAAATHAEFTSADAF